MTTDPSMRRCEKNLGCSASNLTICSVNTCQQAKWSFATGLVNCRESRMPQQSKPLTIPRVHAYAASFGEDFAREVICRSVEKGEVVLDPFVGAGTSALEAVLSDRNAIGIDVDPIAFRISQILTTRIDVPYFVQATSDLRERLRDYGGFLATNPQVYEGLGPGGVMTIRGQTFWVPHEPAIKYWFAPSHMATLAVMRETAAAEPDLMVRRAFEVAISSAIIRKWPNTLSYAMDIDHSRPHRPRHPQAQSIEDQFSLFERVLSRINWTMLNIQEALMSVGSSATILEGDALQQLLELDSSSVGFVLTSPPYLNAIDYPRAHKFSHWWLFPETTPLGRSEYLGLRRAESRGVEGDCLLAIPDLSKDLEPFRDKQIYQNISRYVLDLSAVLEQIHRVLKARGKVALVVANNVMSGAVFPVSSIIEYLLKRFGFSSVETVRRSIKNTRRRYPFGLNGFEGPMRDEYLITGIK